MSVTSVMPSLLDATSENNELIQALGDAKAVRYLSAIGLVAMMYDHTLTFSDEVDLIWRASRSFAKYAFLLNRYLVLGCLLAVAYEMCGFVGDIFTDTGCRRFYYTTSVLSLCSIGLANVLILMRVVTLWDHRPVVLKIMSAVFMISYLTQIGVMFWTLVTLDPGVYWSSVAGMCVLTTTTPTLIAVWAIPMLFEVLVLFSTFINTLDRPRQAELPLTKALYRDGISYFLALTCLRALNLSLSIIENASLTMLGVFFVWAMITTILSRSLLRLKRADLEGRSSFIGSDAPSTFEVEDDEDFDDRDNTTGSSTLIKLETLHRT